MAITSSMRGRASEKHQQYPVGATQNILDGDLVMLDNTGYLRRAAALAANLGCVGWAIGNADNTAGADGAITCLVEEGVKTVTAVGAAAADLGTTAFASAAANQGTVSGAQAANEPNAGVIRRIRSATSIDIECSLLTSCLAAR